MKKINNKYIFIIVVAIISLFLISLKPTISLKGHKKEYLRYNEKYKEKGYTAIYGIKDVTKYVKTKNNINNQKLGTYYVEYYMSEKELKTSVKREVIVYDDVKPKITLEGKSYACPNKPYKEEGFKAIDNYDGDITSKVSTEILDDKVIYKVMDKSKNKTTLVRKLIKKDVEKPNIILKDGNELYIYTNHEFTDPGYEVIDNCDDNLEVLVEGSVNNTQAGDYTLTYRVIDKSGNEEKVSRIVHVRDEIKSGNGKTIYLTFDDGPSSTITPGLLDILKEENVKATFFVINHDDSLNYLIKREYDEGHTVALHSFTHNYSYIYSSANNYFDDLNAISNKVKNITGVESKVIRFPGGSSNTVSVNYSRGIMSYLTKEVVNRGYNYFDWNVSCEDAGGARTKEQVYNNVVNNLRYTNNVVLMHDFESNYKTLNAVRDIIRYGKENGYTFASLNANVRPVRHGVNN